jgi:hypothetical protein
VQKDEIRVIVFNESQTCNITISGNLTGQMKFKRLVRANVSLYTFPFDLPFGNYHIEFNGDFEEKLDFVIGDSVKLDLERVPMSWNEEELQSATCYWYWISLLIATIPMLSFRIGDRVNEWVNGIDDNGHIWAVVSFFVAPLTLRSRLAKLPAKLQYLFFALTLAPLFLPMLISSLNGQVYIVFWAGYLANWRYWFDYLGQLWARAYLGWVVLPLIDTFGQGTLEWTKAMALDWVYCMWGVYVAYHQLDDCEGMNSKLARYTSPLLIIVPQVMIVFTLWYKLGERRRNRRQLLL